MKKRTIWIILPIVLLLAGGGAYAYTRFLAPAEQEQVEQPALQTATVTQGDIVNTVDGSGELLPAAELEVAFRASGTLSELWVAVGDRVEEGDLLARLETDELERALAQAEVEVQIAQLELAEAQAGASEAELANARAALRSAQAELTLAQNAYAATTDSRLDSAVLGAKQQYDWYVGHFQAQKGEFEEGGLSQTDYDHAMNAMISAEGRYQEAINAAQAEELEARDRVSQARNSVYQAAQALEELESGPLTDTLVSKTLAVDQAVMARAEAAADLAAAQLSAPFSGTVMEVTASAGEQVSANGAVLTLATMQEPVVQFWVEESDLAGVAVGRAVNIEFDALPDATFTGVVTRVAPELASVSGTSAVQAWASLELGEREVALLSGMTASVEVIAAQTTGALLVPVEALRKASDGTYSVVVVNADGALETRAVSVGLTSPTQAEILSGLALGETVVTD